MSTKYGHLFVTQMQDCAADMLNEGEAAGRPLPPNLSRPWGLMRKADIPQAAVFAAYSWVFPTDEEVFWVHPHVHDDFDEVLMWMGSDPDNVHDLGADLYMTIEDERHVLNTTGAVYIPKGVKHCPLGFQSVRRPFTFMALALSGDYTSTRFED
jgi:hypothetical protein